MTSDLYSHCRLCPHECGVDRRAVKGRCGQGAEIRVALAYPHLWEEPCLSGQGLEEPIRGSGTVFFVGCSLGCVYCQNASPSFEALLIASYIIPLVKEPSPTTAIA